MENGSCSIVDGGDEVMVADIACDTAAGIGHQPDLVKVRRYNYRFIIIRPTPAA